MNKIYFVKVDQDDWRFSFDLDGVYVTSYETWKQKVKEEVFNNKEEYYDYFMKYEYNDTRNNDFEKWVDYHIDFDSHCEKVEVLF